MQNYSYFAAEHLHEPRVEQASEDEDDAESDGGDALLFSLCVEGGCGVLHGQILMEEQLERRDGLRH